MPVNRFALCPECPAHEALGSRSRLYGTRFKACVDKLVNLDRTAYDSEGTPVEISQDDITIITDKFGVSQVVDAIAGCFAQRQSGECAVLLPERMREDLVVQVNERYL